MVFLKWLRVTFVHRHDSYNFRFPLARQREERINLIFPTKTHLFLRIFSPPIRCNLFLLEKRQYRQFKYFMHKLHQDRFCNRKHDNISERKEYSKSWRLGGQCWLRFWRLQDVHCTSLLAPIYSPGCSHLSTTSMATEFLAWDSVYSFHHCQAAQGCFRSKRSPMYILVQNFQRWVTVALCYIYDLGGRAGLCFGASKESRRPYRFQQESNLMEAARGAIPSLFISSAKLQLVER